MALLIVKNIIRCGSGTRSKSRLQNRHCMNWSSAAKRRRKNLLRTAHGWSNFYNITALDREVVVTLIDKIYVYENREVHIDFNFRDEMAEIYDLLNAAKKEAV